MKKQTHTPAREYETSRYAVWTTLPRGTTPSSKEVIITGRCDDLPKSALARKIGVDSGDRLTRVQVIKKGPNRFVAWVTVVSDNIYPFVDFFNSSKKMSGCRAALKHSTDCAKKVVLHGVKGRSEDDIKAMLGASKVRNVLKKHNTAFVVLESETYAEAVLRNNVPIPAEVEAQRFNQRPRDPIKAVSKRLTKMYKELLAVVTDLSRQVSELKQAMTTGTRIPLESPSPVTPDRVPESPRVTPTTTVDWESMMPESPPSTIPTAAPEPTATTVFRPVFSILDAQEKNDEASYFSDFGRSLENVADPVNTTSEAPLVNKEDEDARNRAILERALSTSKVLKKIKRDIARRALALDRAKNGNEEEEVVEWGDSDSDCELQSPQLNEHKKRTARVTTSDIVANKIPARLASIKSGALRRSLQLARGTVSSDFTSGVTTVRGGRRSDSLKKGKLQQHSKKRMTNAA